MRLFVAGLSLLALGCPSRPGPSPTATPPPAPGPPAASERAADDHDADVPVDRFEVLIERLNAQCQAADDCDTAAGIVEGPVSADTAQQLEATRAELEPLGHDVTYVGHGFGLQALHDLRTITGGHFTVDHIGPDAVQAIQDRVRARPSMYLALFQDRFLPAGHAVAWRYDSVFLTMLRDVEPERVQAIAAGLVDECDHALANPPADADDNWSIRVESRRRVLVTYLPEE